WIIQKILNDPGGMHNRVTRHLHVQPFTLSEAREYLDAQHIELTDTDFARTYMALGGIPYYLKSLQRGDSFATAIERICFQPTGALFREYRNLFKALFRNAAAHEAIVSTLAQHPAGLGRTALSSAAGIRSQSVASRVIEELTASDFITYELAHKGKKRGARYRLTDEFTLFYQQFMASGQQAPGWMQQVRSPRYRSWAGIAFELLCRKHVGRITDALGISVLHNWTGPLHLPPTDADAGVQIDLLIDRPDDTVNLCEMKFYAEPFTLDKAGALELLRKKARVRSYFKDRKQVVITVVTNHPAVENKWFREVIDQQVTLAELIA
ncbi:MAG: ATPase, partial [Bacteroidota bacterium]